MYAAVEDDDGVIDAQCAVVEEPAAEPEPVLLAANAPKAPEPERMVV